MKRYMLISLLLAVAFNVSGQLAKNIGRAILVSGIGTAVRPHPPVNPPVGPIPHIYPRPFVKPDTLPNLSPTHLLQSTKGLTLPSSIVQPRSELYVDEQQLLRQALFPICCEARLVDQVDICHVCTFHPLGGHADVVTSISYANGKLSQDTYLQDEHITGRAILLERDRLRHRLPLREIEGDTLGLQYMVYTDYDSIFTNLYPRTTLVDYPSKQAINYIFFFPIENRLYVLFARASATLQTEDEWNALSAGVMQSVVTYIESYIQWNERMLERLRQRGYKI